MRKFVAIAALALLVLAFRPAAAAMLGDAAVSYRAMRTVTVNGHTYTGPVFHEPGHQRHEQVLLGMNEVFLLDIEAARGFLMLPSVKTYVEFPFPPLMADLDSPDLLAHPLGHDEIDGVDTVKYRVDHTAADGSRARGFLWVTKSRILMKLDLAVTRPHGGKPLLIAMALSDLKTGPVDPALFEIPQGLVQLPADALTPLLGGPAGGR